MDAIQLGLFSSRIAAICDEMGAVLRCAAFSPNIRDRLDYSCAVFDPDGQLCAQAAHIPVHLGSMAYAIADVVRSREWVAGDMLVVNDPFQGGTHLPDVTLIAPVFLGEQCAGFVANRAHHADIGCDSPGSMPIASRLEEEGLLISPALLVENGEVSSDVLGTILRATQNAEVTQGDFSAQISANLTGVRRIQELIGQQGREEYLRGMRELNDYGERVSRKALSDLPNGRYSFADFMDDDGLGTRDIRLQVEIKINAGLINVDFSGTAKQVAGNINCPIAVAAAAVFYVFRCLMPSNVPACAGSFRPIQLKAEPGSLVNACFPAAVAAGNVETSSRMVDLILGALAKAIPEKVAAASQGTMNNLAMGSHQSPDSWDYYETIAGGMGANVNGGGLSAVQTHMTNTLNTPIEVLEANFPLRIKQYRIRENSGGAGLHCGGDGLSREYEFLDDAQATLITERRQRAPWGMLGGLPGSTGKNSLNGQPLDAKIAISLNKGDRLLIETPGGGGFGETKGS